jgi:hypothetical protein
MKLEFSRNILEYSTPIKFHENRAAGADGRTDGKTDMTKLTVAFRNFISAPKKR